MYPARSAILQVYAQVTRHPLKSRDPSPAHKLARTLGLRGKQVSPTRFVSDDKPYCDDPVTINRHARGGRGLRSVEVTMTVPCRKCEKCLLFRRLKWRERVLSEISSAKRTWFVTLTFEPVHYAGIIFEATRYPKMDPDAAVDRAAYQHVQRWLKLVRKRGGKLVSLRYFAVFERGDKHGRAHYHLFIHETGERPVTYRLLQHAWKSPVFHAVLVDDDPAAGLASYVTSYTQKDFRIRPRASERYGKLS